MLRTVPSGIKTRGQWIISPAVTGLLPGLRVNKKSPWRSHHGLSSCILGYLVLLVPWRGATLRYSCSQRSFYASRIWLRLRRAER